jgi:hypothetical protein
MGALFTTNPSRSEGCRRIALPAPSAAVGSPLLALLQLLGASLLPPPPARVLRQLAAADAAAARGTCRSWRWCMRVC